MKSAVLVLVFVAAAAALPGSEAPPPASEGTPPPATPAAKKQEAPSKADEAPPSRHKLGGGFKGQTAATAPGGGAAPAPKPAAAPKRGAPALVIDNKMVKGAAGEPAPSSRAPAPPPPAAAPPPAPAEMPKIVDLQGHDEAYWRARAAAVRDAAKKAEDALAAAEAEEKREESDFYSWDDGQYRDNVIKPAWDRAKEETVKARAGLQAARKDLEGLEDEARRAGAFPGWIR